MISKLGYPAQNLFLNNQENLAVVTDQEYGTDKSSRTIIREINHTTNQEEVNLK